MNRRRRLWLYCGILALTLVCALNARVLVLSFRTFQDVQTLRSALATDGVSVSGAARALVQDGRGWRTELTPLIEFAPRLSGLPYFGGDLEQLPPLAELMDRVLDAAEPSLVVYDGLDAKSARGDPIGGALIALAHEDADQIRVARETLEKAKVARAEIDERDLSPQAHAVLRELNSALNEWDGALRLLQRAPDWLGEAQTRRYLVLAQNDDEIRPTGGFISAAGVVKVERGEISIEWFGDSFAADDLTLIHPAPPEPLAKYMWASQWLLRDVNWYADFPTTARKAQEMVLFDRRVQTDGVVAVDLRFLPRLVGAVPNVQLGGQPLAQENVIPLLKASWRPMPPGDMSDAWFKSDRKSFLGELMNGMLTQLRAGEVRTNALAVALLRGLREKSVQVYLSDAEAEQAVVDAGWGGAMRSDGGDTLFVVDSNLGFNKVNARVKREVEYDVRLDEQGGGQATVAVTYVNPSRAAEGDCDLLKQHKDNTYASMEESCYWNYVRVLAPRGSRMQSAEGMSDAGVVDDIPQVTAFGGCMIVPRDTTHTIKFEYVLPAGLVQDEQYLLHLQAQAGMGATPVTVRVTIPEGRRVRGATHPYRWVGTNVLEFRIRLEQDTTLGIYFDRGS